MTRLEIIAAATTDTMERIAAKLHNDGLTVATYTIESANAILANCALATKLIVLNEEFDGAVKYYMSKLEA